MIFDNTKPSSLSPSALRVAVEKELENMGRNGGRFLPPQSSSSNVKMSTEERQRAEQQQSIQYRIYSTIQNHFEYIAEKSPSPMRLLCVPELLAQHHFIGTNAAMCFLLNTGSVRSEEDAQDFTNELEQYPRIPKLSDIARKLYVIEKSRNLKVNDGAAPYTLSECYWLSKLCEWLHCVDSFFATEINTKLTYDKNLAEVDFTKRLLLEDPQQQQLCIGVIQQYKKLETLLQRL